MIFELCPGGDLFDRVASKQFLKEKEVIRIVKKMCSALTYLHDRSGDWRPPVDPPSRACLRSAGRPAGFFRRARSLVARVHACALWLLGCGLVRRRSDGALYRQRRWRRCVKVSTQACILSSILRVYSRRHIVHRDIKLENWIFEGTDEDAEIKLIDFGLSVVYADNEK